MRHALALAVLAFVVAAGTSPRPAWAAQARDSARQPLRLAQNDSNQNLLRLFQQIQQLQQQVRDLQGQVDTLKYQLKQDDQAQRNLYQNLDNRLSALENGGSGGGATGPAQGGGDYGSGNGQNTGQGGNNGGQGANAGGIAPAVQSAYTNAFNKLKNGKYDAAISAFKTFVSQHPQTPLSDNAWYWLGEAYYVKQDYGDSTHAFETVVNNFKNSPKIPDSLYKIGLIQANQGETDNAEGTLHRITQEYPHSDAARLAQQKLQSMGS